MVIFDTNILIELYRGNIHIKEYIEARDFQKIFISEITFCEFLAGARNKQEFQLLKQYLEIFEIIPLNSAISKKFRGLFEKYLLSNRPSIPDLLIAASSLEQNIPLYSLNTKDFKFIEGLELLKV